MTALAVRETGPAFSRPQSATLARMTRTTWSARHGPTKGKARTPAHRGTARKDRYRVTVFRDSLIVERNYRITMGGIQGRSWKDEIVHIARATRPAVQ